MNEAVLCKFPSSDFKKYEKAIREYKRRGGDLELYVFKDALTSYTLNTKSPGRDHSYFWKIFRQIEETV